MKKKNSHDRESLLKELKHDVRRIAKGINGTRGICPFHKIGETREYLCMLLKQNPESSIDERIKQLLSALRKVMKELDETRKEIHSKHVKSVREDIADILSKYESQINNRTELKMNCENNSRHDGIYDWARRIIRRRLRPLVGLFGLTWDDLPDIEQDIMLRIFKNIGTYNSEQGGMETFILHIIECKIKDIINHRQAARRDWRQCRISLNEVIMTDVGPMERVELLQYDNDPDCNLAVDVAAVVERLPLDLKELCIILKYYSPSEALHEYGRSRTVFYKKIKRLRQFFQTAFRK